MKKIKGYTKQLVCPKHGKTAFYCDHLRTSCKRCVADAVSASRKKKKRVLEAMLGGKCMRCSYSACPDALHFHHVDPASKEFGVGREITRPWDRVVQEARKCVLLCSNCHAELHAGLWELQVGGNKVPRVYRGPNPSGSAPNHQA